jgi:hypothetical protein
MENVIPRFLHLLFHIKVKAGRHFTEQSNSVSIAILRCKTPCGHQLLRGREHSASIPQYFPFLFNPIYENLRQSHEIQLSIKQILPSTPQLTPIDSPPTIHGF